MFWTTYPKYRPTKLLTYTQHISIKPTANPKHTSEVIKRSMYEVAFCKGVFWKHFAS